SAEAYIEECIGMLGPVRKSKVADRVDIFVEKGFFTGDHAVHFLDAAAKAGFKGAAVHLDQLSRTGFVETFVQRGVLSLDDCVHLSDQDIEVLAPSRTTAVLLPISDLYLNIDYPPARKLIDSGARVALATDFNPGTAPRQDLSLLGVLSRLKTRMSLAEVLCA